VTNSRLLELDKIVTRRELLQEERQLRVLTLEQTLTKLRREDKILTATDQALLTISTSLLGRSIDTLDKLVTSGLKAVFDDQKMAFSAKVERYRGKTSVRFELNHDGIIAPIKDSYGGGIQVLVGVLLRIAVIITLGLRRILILDESLAHVSPQYVPNVSQLLRTLAEELDFEIIVISHDEEFATSADMHYQAQDGGFLGTVFKQLHPPPKPTPQGEVK